MKRLAMLVFLLLANLAFAFDIKIDRDTLIAPIESTTKADIMFSDADDTILLSLVGEKPWMLLTPTQFAIKKGENITVSLFVSPKADTSLGLYRVRVLAEASTTKEKKSADLFISVEKESGVYIERLLVSGDLEPTGTMKAEFHLKNFGTATVNGALLSGVVQGKSRLFEFSEGVDNLDPLKTKVVEKMFPLPQQLPAGEYVITARLTYQDVIRELETKFLVAERAVIRKDVIDYTSFATGYSKAITIANLGNKVGEYTLKETISNFDSIFYSGTEPTSASDSEYVWKVANLKPGDIVTISYKVDYTPLILFLLAILLFSWYILVKLRTVRLTKFIMQRRVIEEGAEFTIGLDVKNASGSNADEVVVRDFVPPVFDVKEGDGPKPIKRKAAHGTELEWKLGELFNKEERILSYKIVPVFGVHGQIALPTAGVRFGLGGRKAENKSNVTAIGVPGEKAETLEDLFLKKKKGKSE